jgi:hypothetical protein
MRTISSTRERFRSTSKRPPERLQAALQLGDVFLRRSGHLQVSRGSRRRPARHAAASAAAVAAAQAQAKRSPNLV